jgi:beta-lactamase regulating signal transducer with metallopeptidase domain
MVLELALAVTVATGCIGVMAVLALHRFTDLQGAASSRFGLWLALLGTIALAGPVCYVGGSLLLASPPARMTPVISAHPSPRDAVAAAVRAIRAKHSLPVARPAAAPRAPSAAIVALIVWLTGFGFALSRVLIGLLRLRTIRENAELIESRVSARGPVAILASSAFGVPIAMGYRTPAILLPPETLALENDADYENVVQHELEHVSRYDDVTSLLQSVLLCALWFNPFAYFVAGRIAIEREMACDEAVASRTGKRAYAATLWKMALDASPAQAPLLASAFRSGSTVARLNNLLRHRSRTAARYDLAAVAAVLVTVLLATAAVSPAVIIEQQHVVGSTSVQLPGGDILVTGGMTQRGAIADAQLYSVSWHSFERIAPMNVARAGHSATLLPNGDVVIAGGEKASGALVSTTEIYHAATRTFTRMAEGEGRVGQSALVIDAGEVLMFGGDDRKGRNCVFIYNAKRDAYRTAGTLVRADAHSLTFKLPGGRIVTHSV